MGRPGNKRTIDKMKAEDAATRHLLSATFFGTCPSLICTGLSLFLLTLCSKDLYSIYVIMSRNVKTFILKTCLRKTKLLSHDFFPFTCQHTDMNEVVKARDSKARVNKL